MQAKHRTFTLSNRLYNLLLHAYPASFRNEYGREMIRLFRDDASRTVQAVGTQGMLRLWLVVLPDLLVTALAEHLWEIFNMPWRKLQRWSAPASAFGGLLFLLPFSAWFADLRETVRLPLALPGMLLGAIGLTGLYQHLRANDSRGSVPAFGLAIAGVLLILSNVVIRLAIGIEQSSPMPVLLIPRILCLMIGLAAMSIITLLHKVLGQLSFAPGVGREFFGSDDLGWGDRR